MIAKRFEEFLLSYLEHYLIPARDLVISIDIHNSDRAMPLLASNGYSRVPVIIKDKRYVGTTSTVDIMSYRTKNQLTDWELTQTDIGKMVNVKMKTISEMSSLTDIMHLLVGCLFLSVLNKNDRFLDIITRKSILRVMNSLLHDFTDYYTITPKDD